MQYLSSGNMRLFIYQLKASDNESLFGAEMYMLDSIECHKTVTRIQGRKRTDTVFRKRKVTIRKGRCYPKVTKKKLVCKISINCKRIWQSLKEFFEFQHYKMKQHEKFKIFIVTFQSFKIGQKLWSEPLMRNNKNIFPKCCNRNGP